MEEIHKRKAEVKRSKMLNDQAEARRQKNKDARKRREDKAAVKLQELLKSLGDQVDVEEKKEAVVEQPAPAKTEKPAKAPKEAKAPATTTPAPAPAKTSTSDEAKKGKKSKK